MLRVLGIGQFSAYLLLRLQNFSCHQKKEDFPQLKVLQLHSNRIESFGNVTKLSRLPALRSLTLKGNPIERNRSYRFYVLHVLPQVRESDVRAPNPTKKQVKSWCFSKAATDLTSNQRLQVLPWPSNIWTLETPEYKKQNKVKLIPTSVNKTVVDWVGWSVEGTLVQRKRLTPHLE